MEIIDPPSRRVPLYRQVAESLRKRYIEGQPAGLRIPTERELSAALEMSMATIRSALSELENAGQIERRVGSGTYTLTPPPSSQRHIAILLEADISSPLLSPYFTRLLQELRLALLKLNIPSRPYLGYLRVGVEIGELTCRDFLDELRQDRISGVAAILARRHASWISELRKRNLPLVGSWRSADYVVDIDAEAVVSRTLESFRAAERRHLAAVCLKNDDANTFLKAVQKQAPERGFSLSLFRLPFFEAAKENNADWQEFRAIWQSERRPDCLLVSDDMLFPGVQQVLLTENTRYLEGTDIVVHGSDAVPLVAQRPVMSCLYSIRSRAAKMAETLQNCLEKRKTSRLVTVPFFFKAVQADETIRAAALVLR